MIENQKVSEEEWTALKMRLEQKRDFAMDALRQKYGAWDGATPANNVCRMNAEGFVQHVWNNKGMYLIGKIGNACRAGLAEDSKKYLAYQILIGKKPSREVNPLADFPGDANVEKYFEKFLDFVAAITPADNNLGYILGPGRTFHQILFGKPEMG